MRSIQWNTTGQRLIPPMERDRYERGEAPRRLVGRFRTDELGNVWYQEGNHKRLVAEGRAPTLADGRPATESAAARDLDASQPTSAKRARPAKKRARK